MDRESVPPDTNRPALPPVLGDLCRAIESLRDHLADRGGADVTTAGAARDPARVGVDADGVAVGLVQELLAGPSPDLAPNDLFSAAVDRAARVLAADRAMLFVAEPGGGRLVPRAAYGFRKEDLGSTSIQAGDGMIGRAFTDSRVLSYPAASGGAADAFIQGFPVREAVAVPVRAAGKVAGVLYVGRCRAGVPFTVSDTLVLLIIADEVGGGLVREVILERHARQIARLADLGRLAGHFLASRPLPDVVAAICEVGCRLADVPAVAVALDAGGGELALVGCRGLPMSADRYRVSTHDGLTARLYSGEEVVVCRDVQARCPSERSFLGDGGFRACLLLPLMLGGDAGVGVLYLADPRMRDFATDEIEAARVLAAMAASAIRHSAGREAGGALSRGGPVTNDRAIQIEKARALGEMASGLSRELNNVFAIILGKSRLLLARVTNDPLREGLGTLEDAAWRGADVVHRLMALVSPGPGEVLAPVDMAGLTRDAIALTEPRWKTDEEGRAAGIDVVLDLQGVPPVRGSESGLREVLVNLVLNAVDAMAAGGRLAVSTRPFRDGVEVAIEDTGEGMSDDVRGRAFDAFFTTRATKRMGLGLTVAQGVILRHGGSIDIASVHRGGTRVTVWLPRERSAAPASPRERAPGPGTAPAGAGRPLGLPTRFFDTGRRP